MTRDTDASGDAAEPDVPTRRGSNTDRAAFVQAKRAAVQRQASGGDATSPDVQSTAAEGVFGGGGALPHLDSVQGAFGRHDVTGVQAHVGGGAAEACDSIGAEAYATGDSVAFRESPDLHTAAHEAAHVVQQRSGVHLAGGVGREGDPYEVHADRVADLVVSGQSAEAELDKHGKHGKGPQRQGATQRSVVQRKGRAQVKLGSKGSAVKVLQQRLNAKGQEPPLKVTGTFEATTDAAVRAYQRAHKDAKGKQLVDDGIAGPLTWGSIEAGHKAEEIPNTEVALGEHVADEMDKNNQDPHTEDRGVHYDFNYKAAHPAKWVDDYSNGYADPQYFTRIGWMDWRLKEGMSASAGIKAWLRGLTIAECNSAIVAQQTDAVRAAIGNAKFDERFGSTDKKVPESQRMRVKVGMAGSVVDGMNESTEGAKKDEPGSANARPVKKGDWCYFYNHPQYLLKHPGGAYQGENAIYMGTDVAGDQIWSGMGVDNKTELKMLEAMMSDYNRARNDWDQKELDRIKADNGGTLPTEYDLKGGVFPETIASAADILSAPAYTLDGTTRKGGFIADNPSHLDTAKVDELKK